jgi:HD-GYP domain-containing protein (c-di-GMP phosphodiesterase class II)
MEQHTIVGEAICQALGPIAEEVAQAVRHHHERWDGQGYPEGLAGERIPLTARILAVADAYDVMTRRNLYSKALTPGQALETVRQEAGKQFDPLIALAFCRMISDYPTALTPGPSFPGKAHCTTLLELGKSRGVRVFG